MNLTDSLGRRINYLRLSVTDRCNLRCFYCMPPEGIMNRGHGAILRYEELQVIAETAVALGIGKIRVTGGEPLIRKGILPFLKGLASIPRLDHLVLTTNGLLLPELAGPLRQAGVQRLNVSLDSLRPERYATITRGGEMQKVLLGLEAAEQAGFPPPKINVVVMAGVNDDEILDFVELACTRGNPVRFIEYMPVVRHDGWQRYCVPGGEIMARIAEHHDIAESSPTGCAGPSRDFHIDGGRGRIGIITPLSGHFCGGCNRIRVTAAGRAKGCLFDNEGIDLLPWMRPENREGLRRVLKGIVRAKPERHEISSKGYRHRNFSMSQIGG